MSLAPLLLPSEKPAAIVENESGQHALVLICEHAGREIPQALGNLGLHETNTTSHIAWDIGAAAVTREVAQLLDAPLILQRYSRLVYDCNRAENASSTIPTISASIEIPSNIDLNDNERKARYKEIYLPFETAICRIIDNFIEQGKNPAVVSIHSFTKIYNGEIRNLDLGVLHDSDSSLADEILSLAENDSDYITRRNEPYGPQDAVTYTINLHGVDRGLLNVMIEICNELISDEEGQRLWAHRLAKLLASAINNSLGILASQE